VQRDGARNFHEDHLMERHMAKKLEGKIAVITGATSGIGLATAKHFAAEGAYVFITGRRKAELDAAVASIGANAAGVLADSANLADLDRLFETICCTKAGSASRFVRAAGAGSPSPNRPCLDAWHAAGVT
jgi:hypothetical protein